MSAEKDSQTNNSSRQLSESEAKKKNKGVKSFIMSCLFSSKAKPLEQGFLN